MQKLSIKDGIIIVTSAALAASFQFMTGTAYYSLPNGKLIILIF